MVGPTGQGWPVAALAADDAQAKEGERGRRDEIERRVGERRKEEGKREN